MPPTAGDIAYILLIFFLALVVIFLIMALQASYEIGWGSVQVHAAP